MLEHEISNSDIHLIENGNNENPSIDLNNNKPKLKAIVKEGDIFHSDISAESDMIDNKIVVWYTLEQTLDYLENREKVNISGKDREKLDKIAVNNLNVMVQENLLNEDLVIKLKPLFAEVEPNKPNKNEGDNNNQNENENDNNDNNDINTDLKPLKKNNENDLISIEKGNRLELNKDAIKGFFENDNNESIGEDFFKSLVENKNNENMENVKQDFNNLLGIIENKTKNKVDEKNNDNIENKNENKMDAKKNDNIENKIENKVDEKNNDNIENKIENKVDAKNHDNVVFLSQAADKFQDKVKGLESVKNDEVTKTKVDKYNKAVKTLNENIDRYLEKQIEGFVTIDKQQKTINGKHKKDIKNLLASDKGKNNFENTLFKNENNNENKDAVLNFIKNDINVNALNDQKSFEKHFGENFSVSEFNAYTEALRDLPDNTDNLVVENNRGKEITQEQLNDLYKNKDLLDIANKGINKKNGFQEYGQLLIQKKLGGEKVVDINGKMRDFLSGLLLSSVESDKFKLSKELLSCISNEINKNGDNAIKSGLQDVVKLGGANQSDPNKQVYFVPNFIENLFNVEVEDKNLDNLANNIRALENNNDFKSLLEKMINNEDVVKMIEDNFTKTEKTLNKTGDKTTRWHKFKKEFLDNNLKGQFTKWQGRVQENIASIGMSLLGGMAGGSILLNMLPITLPAVVSVLVIIATATLAAALISLVLTIVKGVKDWRADKGFFKPSSDEKNEAQRLKKRYAQKIYTVFCTLGANRDILSSLVNNKSLNENSPQGKFFLLIKKMKAVVERYKQEIGVERVERCGLFKPLSNSEKGLKNENLIDNGNMKNNDDNLKDISDNSFEDIIH